MILYLTINEKELDYMNFKKFKDSLLGLREIMEEIENTKDECELKIWELIKTRKNIRRIYNRKRRRVRIEIIKSNK